MDKYQRELKMTSKEALKILFMTCDEELLQDNYNILFASQLEEIIRKDLDKLEKSSWKYDVLPPTIEEVKKEWEELGYEFSFKNENNLLDIVNLEELSVIKIDIKGRKYIKVNCVNYSGFVPLTYEEHILLTKIFIALGWL